MDGNFHIKDEKNNSGQDDHQIGQNNYSKQQFPRSKESLQVYNSNTDSNLVKTTNGDLTSVSRELAQRPKELDTAFEQKVYDLTGMSSERLSGQLTRDDHRRIFEKVADAARQFGWEGVMERATHVIQQVNNENCFWIIRPIDQMGMAMGTILEGLSGWPLMPDRDQVLVTRGFAKMLHNERLALPVQKDIVEIVSRLGNQSVSPDLTEVLSQRQIDPEIHSAIEKALTKLQNKPDNS